MKPQFTATVILLVVVLVLVVACSEGKSLAKELNELEEVYWIDRDEQDEKRIGEIRNWDYHKLMG